MIQPIKYFYKYFLMFLPLFFSCSNNTNDNEETSVAADVVEDSVVITPIISPDKMYVWKINAQNETVTKNPDVNTAILNADSLVKGINFRYPDIKLEIIKQSNDTLYMQIKDATYLTQRMGSSGPVEYIGDVYFNLTAVDGIKFIHLDFQQGDHAQPGVFGPDLYKGYVRKQ